MDLSEVKKERDALVSSLDRIVEKTPARGVNPVLAYAICLPLTFCAALASMLCVFTFVLVRSALCAVVNVVLAIGWFAYDFPVVAGWFSWGIVRRLVRKGGWR